MSGPCYSRRSFLKTSTAAALGAVTLFSTRPRKPNLLFLWTDQQQPSTMQAYGNDRIQTPNLNKLSHESFVFDNTYVTQPVCTPSRCSVMTGLWPHTSGLTHNNILLPKEIPCLPELLNDPDYRTAYMGKWHLGDEIFAQHGFQEWKSSEEYQRYYRPERPKDQRSSYWDYLKGQGFEPDENKGYYSRNFASNLPIEHAKPRFLENCACDFLRRCKTDPFILYVNFLEPHTPYHGPLDDLHPENNIHLPNNHSHVPNEKDPLRYRLIAEQIRDKGYKGLDLKTEAGWTRVIRNYWGLVSQVDLSIGGILHTLEQIGQADNTIVVFTSDHGDMMGSHGLYAKSVMYEESSRVPFLLKVPWANRSMKHISQPISHIDMLPTLLDLLGKDPTNCSLPGKSLVKRLTDTSAAKGPAFIEWNPPDESTEVNEAFPGYSQEQISTARKSSIRTVVTPDGWKLSLSDMDKNQLFNLTLDPLETLNLYDQSESREVIARLTGLLISWQEKVKDALVL